MPPVSYRRSAVCGLLRHYCLTRYLNTASRLSSGDMTSWIVPTSPLAANCGEPGIELVRLIRLYHDRILLEVHADDMPHVQKRARHGTRPPPL